MKDLLFLNIKRETLPGDNIKCGLCGQKLSGYYHQVGFVSIEKRANKLCPKCHEVVYK